MIEPKGCYDLAGWTEITCWQAEIVRRPDLSVASSYTDVDTPDVFTEWWTVAGDKVARSVPVLREYRDRNGCRHYLAGAPEEAALEVEEWQQCCNTPQQAAARLCGCGGVPYV